MKNSGKNSRDTAFTAFAGLIGALVGQRYGTTPEEAVLYSTLATTVAGAGLVVGWRALRHYCPWVTEE